MPERSRGGCEVVRLFAGGIFFSAGLVAVTPCMGADIWGGSIGVTSDYIVRGISRSNDRPALQLDLHYLNSSGFVAGLLTSVSNTGINRGESADVELDAFFGIAWTAGEDWRGKVLATHYAYPWSLAGSKYAYDELDLDVAYQGWLNAAVVVSPDAPRFLVYRGAIRGASESAEVSVQRPLLRKVSATAGIGYSYFDGADSGGYAYWSVGAAWDLAPVALAVSYVKSTSDAKLLFYDAAETGRWTATAIWRF
jgi:uncharacterized protein (TIGR02001 family)